MNQFHTRAHFISLIGGAVIFPPNQFTAVPFSVGKKKKNSPRSNWKRSVRPGVLPTLVADKAKC
jgi:hypothetical protein